MVCRDANTHKAREVNPLIIATSEERTLYAMGERMSIIQWSPPSQGLIDCHRNEMPPPVCRPPFLVACAPEFSRSRSSTFILASAWAAWRNYDGRPRRARVDGRYKTGEVYAHVSPGKKVGLIRRLILLLRGSSLQFGSVHQKVFGGYLMRLAYEVGFFDISGRF